MIIHWPLVSVSVEREEIPVSTLRPARVPDERWRLVDAAGHGHFWQGNDLPTLDWIVTGKGGYPDGTEYDIGEHRCKLCGQTVEPGMKDEQPKPVYGPTQITVQVDGDEFLLDEEGYEKSVATWKIALANECRHMTHREEGRTW